MSKEDEIRTSWTMAKVRKFELTISDAAGKGEQSGFLFLQGRVNC